MVEGTDPYPERSILNLDGAESERGTDVCHGSSRVEEGWSRHGVEVDRTRTSRVGLRSRSPGTRESTGSPSRLQPRPGSERRLGRCRKVPVSGVSLGCSFRRLPPVKGERDRGRDPRSSDWGPDLSREWGWG